MVIFETKNLLLRPLQLEDADRLFLLDKDPEVMKYIGVPVLTNVQQSVEVIKMIQQQYEQFGVGRYAVVEKARDLLIGWSGLKMNTDTINGHQNFYELGYRLMPEFWGKGYATESSQPFLDYAFNTLKTDEVVAYIHHENKASQHVLEKLNFTKTSEFTEPDGLCHWYQLLNKNYTR